ncbi:hypothetical protein Tco_1162408 [Tanacetum coccineum]
MRGSTFAVGKKGVEELSYESTDSKKSYSYSSEKSQHPLYHNLLDFFWIKHLPTIVFLLQLHAQGRPGHLTDAMDYFFNNDLEYLKTSDPEKTYTTSITKTIAARYEIVGIEDTVPTLWSTIKHAYDKDAAKGIKHWAERCKLWYRSQMNKFSKQNVDSTQKILGVKSVSVKKVHGYGHLEEVLMKRVDRQLYKFKECDFVDLHLNDIKDMLILVVQHKLSISTIVTLLTLLWLFVCSQ